jgi:hypothetical protein
MKVQQMNWWLHIGDDHKTALRTPLGQLTP